MTNGQPGLVVLIGHPRPGSRTHSVALRAAALLRRALADGGTPPAEPHLIDLAELAPRLLDACADSGQPARAGGANGANGGDAGWPGIAQIALQAVGTAPLLLIVSPTFRGACSGLLKLFLDMLPRGGLRAVVTVPLMTAGIPAHRSAVDTTLRPILLELQAQVPAAGICVLETELGRFDEVFDAWWTVHGPALREAVRAGAAGQAGQVRSC
jgi:FMN reductase